MRIQAFGAMKSGLNLPRQDAFCVGPMTGPTSIRLDLDASSSYIKRYGLLVAVARSEREDGVESASQMFVDELSRRFYAWEDRGSTVDAVRHSVSSYLDEANQAVLARLADAERISSTTTLAGFALLDPDVTVVFHVGDCRVLRHSAGYLRTLTNDHTEERKRRPSTTLTIIPLEAPKFELTRFLGILGSGEPETRMLNWSQGDQFLVGSPGWHGTSSGIARDPIQTGLMAYPDISIFTERSIQEAINADGRTEATLVTVRVS